MSNERHRSGPPASKLQPLPAISHATAAQLNQRMEALEKLMKENFDEKNQWNSLVREWIGEMVSIRLLDSTIVCGYLRWMDRYTICIEAALKPIVVHKGAIATICLG